jgi:hypothetical protein
MKVAQQWSRLVVGCLALSLGACVSGAKPGAMTTTIDPGHLADKSSPYYQAAAVDAVKGGSETNPLWKSNVSNQDFKTALEQSLKINGLFADANPKYTVKVELLDLDQPFAGFSMTVTPKVHYTVIPADGGTPVFDQTFTTPYTAAMGDAFLASERLRLANEGAIRASITAFIDALIDKGKASATPNVPAPVSMLAITSGRG